MTNVQDTSARAFYAMLQTLSDRQIEVYQVLKDEPDMTNLEIARKLGREINTVVPRTNELRKKGIVKECERRPCKITGNTAIAWTINN